jgi:hypothetical protein
VSVSIALNVTNDEVYVARKPTNLDLLEMVVNLCFGEQWIQAMADGLERDRRTISRWRKQEQVTPNYVIPKLNRILTAHLDRVPPIAQGIADRLAELTQAAELERDRFLAGLKKTGKIVRVESPISASNLEAVKLVVDLDSDDPDMFEERYRLNSNQAKLVAEIIGVDITPYDDLVFWIYTMEKKDV